MSGASAAGSAAAAPVGLVRLIHGIETASRIAGVVAMLCLLALLVLVAGEIFYRDLVGQSLGFTWEFAAYCMTATFFVGAAETLRTRGHIRVPMLMEVLGPRGARVLDILDTVVALGVLCFATYAVGLLAYTSGINGARSWHPAQTPLVLPQSVVTLGMALLTLQMFARLLRLLLGLQPDDPPANDLQD